MSIVTNSAEALSAGSTITTSATNMTGMKLFVVVTGCFTGTTNANHDAATPITDSVGGNTYTKLETGFSQTGDQAYGTMFYCLNPSVGSSQTFTYTTTTAATDFDSIAVLGWDGVASSSIVDVGDNAHMTGNNSNSTTTTNCVTANANDLLIAFFGDGNGGAVTITDAGSSAATWNKDQDQNSSSGEAICLAHALVTTTGTYALNFSGFTSGNNYVGIAAFKQAAAGGIWYVAGMDSGSQACIGTCI